MNKIFFLGIIVVLSNSIFSQNISEEKENKKLKFDESFFNAMKERGEENYISEIMFLEKCLEIDSSEYTVYLELGKAYFQIKEFRKAEDNFLKSYNRNPKNINVLEAVCKFYLFTSNIKESVKWLEKIVEINDKYTKDLLIKYIEIEDYSKALELISKMKKNNNDIVYLLEMEKNIYYGIGNYEKAVEICDELIKLEPKNEVHIVAKSYIYTSTNQIQKGLSILIEFAEKNPNKPIINLALANFYLKVNNIMESLRYAKSIIESHKIPEESKMEYIYKLLDYNILKDDTLRDKIEKDIVAFIEDVKIKDPKYLLLLYSFYKKIDNRPKSIEVIKKYINTEKNVQEDIYIEYLIAISSEKDHKFLYDESSKIIDIYPMSPFAYLVKGYTANMLNKKEEALDLFETGLSLVYDNKNLESEFYSNIADVYYKDKNYKKSDSYYEKAIVLNPSNYLVMNNYSYYLSLRGENLEKARDFMEIVINENPDNITYLDTYAWVLYRSKEYKKSLEIIEKILDLLEGTKDEDSFEIRDHSGDIYLVNNLKVQAIEQWNKAIELGGNKRELKNKIKNAK